MAIGVDAAKFIYARGKAENLLKGYMYIIQLQVLQ